MASVKFFATDEQVNEHPFVWVDPGTESETHWRANGYRSQAEMEEIQAKAAEVERLDQAQGSAEEPEAGLRRRGRPRSEA